MTIAAQRWYPVRKKSPSFFHSLLVLFFSVIENMIEMSAFLHTDKMMLMMMCENRSQIRQTPWPTSQRGVTQRKSSKLIFTNPKSSFIVVGAVFLIVN